VNARTSCATVSAAAADSMTAISTRNISFALSVGNGASTRGSMRTRAAASVCGGSFSLVPDVTLSAGAAVEIVTERAEVTKPMRIVGSLLSRAVVISNGGLVEVVFELLSRARRGRVSTCACANGAQTSRGAHRQAARFVRVDGDI